MEKVGRGCAAILFLLILPLVVVAVIFVVRLLVWENEQARAACQTVVAQYTSANLQPLATTPRTEHTQTPLEEITRTNATRLQEVGSFSFEANEIRVTADQIEFYDAATSGKDLSAMRPDQQQIVLIKPGASAPSDIYICDNQTSAVLHSFHTDETTNAGRYNLQGSLLALNEGRGTILILDAIDWNKLATISVLDGATWRRTDELAFHPTTTLLAFAMGDYQNDDYSIRVWDLTTQQEIARLPGATRETYGLAFSDDGTLLAASSLDGTVRLWGVPS